MNQHQSLQIPQVQTLPAKLARDLSASLSIHQNSHELIPFFPFDTFYCHHHDYQYKNEIVCQDEQSNGALAQIQCRSRRTSSKLTHYRLFHRFYVDSAHANLFDLCYSNT